MSMYTPIITDKETALTLVSLNGVNLQFCSEELRDDYDVVLDAVSNYGLSLRIVSERLKNNEDIVFNAYNNNNQSKEFAGDYIKTHWKKLEKTWNLDKKEKVTLTRSRF